MRWFWIDRFTSFVSGQQATALKGVTLAEDHMHDHMFGHPIMPNSLVIEGMAQAGGLLVSEAYRFQELVVWGKVTRAKFHSHVLPGEIVTYQVKVEALGEDGASISATAHIEDRLHANAQFTFARLNPVQLFDTDHSAAEEQAYVPQLFKQSDLMHWLNLVKVFEVGVRPDGTRLQESDYR